jgi:hypothetical protein
MSASASHIPRGDTILAPDHRARGLHELFECIAQVRALEQPDEERFNQLFRDVEQHVRVMLDDGLALDDHQHLERRCLILQARLQEVTVRRFIPEGLADVHADLLDRTQQLEARLAAF